MTDRDVSPTDPQFQRGFVTIAYYAGQRGAALVEPLVELVPEARALVDELGRPERADRARALGSALEAMARALDARRLA